MSRRADRTLFNTEYMPWLEEDVIGGDDPHEMERLTVHRDIIKEDEERFRRLCKENGYDFTKLNREYKRKLKDAEKLKDRLKELELLLRNAGWHNKVRKALLRKEIKDVRREIEEIMR